MTAFIQHVIDALSVGSMYALLALGITLVYSVMNLINFAYGILLVWAAYAVYVLTDWAVPFVLIVPLAVLFVTVLSVGIGRLAFQPFLGAPPITLLITSFGVLLVVQYLAILLFTEKPRAVEVPAFFNDVIMVGSVRIPVLQIITLGTALVVLAVFYVILNRTMFGAKIRAAADLPDVTRLMGVKPDRVLMAVFAISGAIAGIVGILWFAKVGAVGPRADLEPTLKAFIALVLGGLGSTRGAILGGLALGAIEVFMSNVLPDAALAYQTAIVFGVVILLLILRPAGLSGTTVEPAR